MADADMNDMTQVRTVQAQVVVALCPCIACENYLYYGCKLPERCERYRRYLDDRTKTTGR